MGFESYDELPLICSHSRTSYFPIVSYTHTILIRQHSSASRKQQKKNKYLNAQDKQNVKKLWRNEK